MAVSILTLHVFVLPMFAGIGLIAITNPPLAIAIILPTMKLASM